MSDEVPPPVSPETPYTPPQANPTPTLQGGTMPPAEEKNWVLALHLSQLTGLIVPLGCLIAPLVIWLMKKDQSKTIDEHGKEVVNFEITVAIAFAIGFVLLPVFGLGALIWLAVGIMALIFIIMAAVKVSNGEFYRYPLTIRFIK